MFGYIKPTMNTYIEDIIDNECTRNDEYNSSGDSFGSSLVEYENNIPSVSIDSDEIATLLSKIQNKYSGNAEQKHLNQLYDIGILIVNKNFNHHKIVQKLTKIIEERSRDPIKKIRDYKRQNLLDALKQGIVDGLSEEYRFAYNDTNKYIFNSERLKKRAYIDSVLNGFEDNLS